MREAIISGLETTRDRVLSCFKSSTSASERSYAPGKWTLRDLLLHLTDCESVYLDRARRLIADEKPLLWNFDENRWAERLLYRERSLQIAATQFAAERAALIELARLASPQLWQREGVHSERGLMSLQHLLDKTGKHTAHHLEQAEAIVAGKSWP